MIEIKLDGKPFYIPENWEEVSAKMMLSIASGLMNDSPKNRIAVVKGLIPKKLLAKFYQLRPEQVWDIISYLDWMYETSFDKPIIPFFIADDGQTYFVPEEALKRCSIIEFTYADRYFESIVAGDSDKVDNLILSLCRPQRKDTYDEAQWDGDIREKFNPVLISQRVKLLQQVSINFKMYFILYFIGCKKTIARKYSPLFRERDEDEEETNRTPDFGWISIIWDLAGGIVNEEKVQYSNLHNIMAYLCKQYYDNKELERQSKRNELS